MKPPLKRTPALWQNPLSLLGAFIALLATGFGLPMMIFDFFSPHSQVYLAVLIYLVLPFIAMAGVGIILLGMLLESRARRKRPEGELFLWPRIDLNRPSHQAIVMVTALGAILVLALLSVTGYRAYHFSESVEFCGTACHGVMRPQYVAYQNSPHARVACVECHVGPGAEAFMRSKLNGLHQVYSAVVNTYPRPVPAPVKNLRPAQETCEQCHWPSRFFGDEHRTFNHFLSDEANTPWQVQMMVKVGGGNPKAIAAGGIHWHMNIDKQIEYIASDEKRETIPWVRVTGKDGTVIEYQSSENPLTPQQIAAGPLRRMDCVDCHNNPAHIFSPPDRAVEASLSAGLMDASLPYLKREAVRLLIADYPTKEEGIAAIKTGLMEFYRKEYPQLVRERQAAIAQAAEATARIFAVNFFPEMRTDWRAYPNHAAHLNSDGCFRCHDGLHAGPEGKVITKDCSACHVILAQGDPAALAGAALKQQPFQHPVDAGMDVAEYKCSQCHTGTGGQ